MKDPCNLVPATDRCLSAIGMNNCPGESEGACVSEQCGIGTDEGAAAAKHLFLVRKNRADDGVDHYRKKDN